MTLAIGTGVAINANGLPAALDQSSPVARLYSGVENVFSFGTVGTNDRFAGAVDVYQQLDKRDLLAFGSFGYGLNSASPYFAGILGPGVVQDYSLLLTVLFSYGLAGLAVFAVLLAASVIRLLKAQHAYLEFFVPFTIAACINSAQGFQAYKFVVVGMVLAWVGGRRARGSDQRPSSPSSASVHRGFTAVRSRQS